MLRALLEGGVLEHGRKMGAYLHNGLQDLKDRLPMVKEVRGLGLLQGMELTVDGHAVVADCLARGLLLNSTADRVLRFVPPLIITQSEIDRLLLTLSQILSKRKANFSHLTQLSIASWPALLAAALADILSTPRKKA